MTLETDTLTLVRDAAKAFAERHRTTLSAHADACDAHLPDALLTELESLGWLEPLDDEEAPLGPQVLAALVFALGRVSPPLGAQLLCHHFAREWLARALRENANAPSLEPPRGWLALPAYELPRVAPPAPSAAARRATDVLALPMVVGLRPSAALLCVTNSDAEPSALRLVPRASIREIEAVRTLGLTGMDLVDVRLSAPTLATSTVVATGSAVLSSRAVAWRRILPAFVSLCRAVITTSLHTARQHAALRHQGGTTLDQLPQVAEMLTRMQQDEALAALVEQSLLVGNDALELVARVREALLTATDYGVQVLGGAGFIVGTGQERLWRDARQLATLCPPP